MKKIVKLTESDLHKIIKESVKRIIKEDNIYPGYDSTTTDDYGMTTVYRCCPRQTAEDFVNTIKTGNIGKLIRQVNSVNGNAYGKGVYATLTPDMQNMYGDTIVEILVPPSAVKPIHGRRDGDFCVLDPRDIRDANIYNG